MKTSTEKIYNKNGQLRSISFFVLWLSRLCYFKIVLLVMHPSQSWTARHGFLCPRTLKTDKHMVCSYSVTHTLAQRKSGGLEHWVSQCPFSLAWTQTSRKAPNIQLLSLSGRVKVADSFGQDRVIISKQSTKISALSTNQSKWTEVELLWPFLSAHILTVKLMNNFG